MRGGLFVVRGGLITLALAGLVVAGTRIGRRPTASVRLPEVLEISNVQFHRDLQDVGFDRPPDSSPFRPLAWDRPLKSESDVVELVRSLDLSPAALAAGAHADLVSEQSLIHFKLPLLDSIAVFSNAAIDAWIIRQRALGSELPWRTYGITHDKTSSPPLAFYFEVQPTGLNFRGSSCFVCHASGPRVIRALRPDLIVGTATAAAFNDRIAANGDVAMHFPASEPDAERGPTLAASACVECHQPGVRAPLYHVHDESIRALVATGEMPKGRRLSPLEWTEIEKWLLEKPATSREP